MATAAKPLGRQGTAVAYAQALPGVTSRIVPIRSRGKPGGKAPRLTSSHRGRWRSLHDREAVTDPPDLQIDHPFCRVVLKGAKRG